METIEIKKLKKRTSKDLINKVKKENYKDENELKNILTILESRKIDKKEYATEKTKVVKVTSKKVKEEKRISIKNPPITSSFIKIGDEVKFSTKKDGEVKGEVIKIYNCNRTKKDYVRLHTSKGKVYHKLLSYFDPKKK